MQTLCTSPPRLFLLFSLKNFYYYISRQEAKEYMYFQVNCQACNTKYIKNRHGQASKDNCCRRKAWSWQLTLRLWEQVYSGTHLWDSGLIVLMCNPHIPINDLDAGLEGELRKFANDKKLRVAVDTLQGREGWEITNHMNFNKDKCWVLFLGWGSPGCVYRLGSETL